MKTFFIKSFNMNTEKTYTLITGGTSGIGYELAKIFAAKGHNIILVAREEADLVLLGAQEPRRLCVHGWKHSGIACFAGDGC